ncbi:MAG TPA: DUF433 domain-containing protein [Longimicrobium sp.]|jgi:uncharacterized protein (DUF433 family)|nr:DUF433 domain-containing protein [Longimicrobium sp.]
MELRSDDPSSAIPWTAVTERLQARFGHWMQVDVAEPPRTSDGYVIHCDPARVSGAPVFVGTRVPAAILVDHLAHGSTLDEFLDDFPSVTREQAVVFLLQSAEALLERIGAPLPRVYEGPSE